MTRNVGDSRSLIETYGLVFLDPNRLVILPNGSIQRGESYFSDGLISILGRGDVLDVVCVVFSNGENIGRQAQIKKLHRAPPPCAF